MGRSPIGAGTLRTSDPRLEARLRPSLADYELLGPFGPGGAQDGAWLARRPARLGGGAESVVITEVADPGPAGWAALAERLSALSMVRNEHLPRLLEAGRTEEPEGPVAWVARYGVDAVPMTTGNDTLALAASKGIGRLLRAVAGAARGAHALHDAGLAHGDIRPDAVLVAGDKALLDLPLRTVTLRGGVAAPRRESTDFDPVDPTALWGEGPSRAGDIWSLGATAHALVTGRLIHPALAGDPIVTAVQRALIEPPQVSPDLEGTISALVRSCLAPDPADRPATAGDLADRLELLAAGR
jgi:hypothetical protein